MLEICRPCTHTNRFHDFHHRQLPWRCSHFLVSTIFVGSVQISDNSTHRVKLPLTVVSAGESILKLKQIKAYLLSSVGQERLSSLAVIDINAESAQKLSHDDLINNFAGSKCRQVPLESLLQLPKNGEDGFLI